MKHASPAPPSEPALPPPPFLNQAGGGNCAFFFEISANILWQLMEVDALRENLWSVRVGRGGEGAQGGSRRWQGRGAWTGPGSGHGSLAQSWNKQ